MAEKALDLSVLELDCEVSRVMGNGYAAKNTYRVYHQLISDFTYITRAARIRFETEATSQLEYLANSNHSIQVQI